MNSCTNCLIPLCISRWYKFHVLDGLSILLFSNVLKTWVRNTAVLWTYLLETTGHNDCLCSIKKRLNFPLCWLKNSLTVLCCFQRMTRMRLRNRFVCCWYLSASGRATEVEHKFFNHFLTD